MSQRGDNCLLIATACPHDQMISHCISQLLVYCYCYHLCRRRTPLSVLFASSTRGVLMPTLRQTHVIASHMGSVNRALLPLTLWISSLVTLTLDTTVLSVIRNESKVLDAVDLRLIDGPQHSSIARIVWHGSLYKIWHNKYLKTLTNHPTVAP
jgi:hypothetical protein